MATQIFYQWQSFLPMTQFLHVLSLAITFACSKWVGSNSLGRCMTSSINFSSRWKYWRHSKCCSLLFSFSSFGIILGSREGINAGSFSFYISPTRCLIVTERDYYPRSWIKLTKNSGSRPKKTFTDAEVNTTGKNLSNYFAQKYDETAKLRLHGSIIEGPRYKFDCKTATIDTLW